MLGWLLANATPCRRSAPAQLQSGTMLRTEASPATTLPAPLIWLGGSPLSVAAGSRPSTHVQTADGYAIRTGTALQASPEVLGLQYQRQSVWLALTAGIHSLPLFNWQGCPATFSLFSTCLLRLLASILLVVALHHVTVLFLCSVLILVHEVSSVYCVSCHTLMLT